MDSPAADAATAVNCCPKCGDVVRTDPARLMDGSLCPRCLFSRWFLRKVVGDVVVLTFLPRLPVGEESIKRSGEIITAMEDATRLLLDISYMDAITSSFLGMLLAVRREMQTAKATLKLSGLRSEVAQTFQVTHVNKLFDIYPDVPSALESF
jgi:anti-anti-sigma factor